MPCAPRAAARRVASSHTRRPRADAAQLRPLHQGGPDRRQGQQGRTAEACVLRLERREHRGARHDDPRVQGADEGGAEADLLHQRLVQGGGDGVARARPAQAEGVRGALRARPDRRDLAQGVGTFEEVEVIDASKENADLGELSEEEKESESAAKEEFQATCDFLKQALGTQVDKCEVSSRLTTSPSALVQPQWGVSPQMQRFMRAQAAAAGQDDGMMGMASNLEINPRHPAVVKLKRMVEEEKEAAATKDFACLLFDVAAVSSGYEIKDTAAFARRVVSLMSEGIDMTGFMPETSTTVSAPGPGTAGRGGRRRGDHAGRRGGHSPEDEG